LSVQYQKFETGISEIIIHPRYRSHDFRFDIALLRTSLPFQNAKIFRLTSKKKGDTKNEHLVILDRFNMMLHSRYRIRGVEITRLTKDNEFCRNLHHSFICAKFGNFSFPPKNCNGKSGEPMWDNNRHVLIGILSHGIGCHNNTPAAFTSLRDRDVSKFIAYHVPMAKWGERFIVLNCKPDYTLWYVLGGIGIAACVILVLGTTVCKLC